MKMQLRVDLLLVKIELNYKWVGISKKVFTMNIKYAWKDIIHKTGIVLCALLCYDWYVRL